MVHFLTKVVLFSRSCFFFFLGVKHGIDQIKVVLLEQQDTRISVQAQLTNTHV